MIPIIIPSLVRAVILRLFDRVFLGHVVDFIAITFNPYVFNLADVFITIGIVLYLINYFKVKEQNS